MTHNELLDRIAQEGLKPYGNVMNTNLVLALRSVVELHKPSEVWGDTHCGFCFDLAWEPSGMQMDSKHFIYPCATIQAIEKELA